MAGAVNVAINRPSERASHRQIGEACAERIRRSYCRADLANIRLSTPCPRYYFLCRLRPSCPQRGPEANASPKFWAKRHVRQYPIRVSARPRIGSAQLLQSFLALAARLARSAPSARIAPKLATSGRADATKTGGETSLMKAGFSKKFRAVMLCSAVEHVRCNCRSGAGTGAGPTCGRPPMKRKAAAIVITGSRIARRDYTATSPIVTVDAQLLDESSAVNLEANLNKLPCSSPALTQFDTQGLQANANVTIGISTVSLRQLGSNRNLVLVDGRRADAGQRIRRGRHQHHPFGSDRADRDHHRRRILDLRRGRRRRCGQLHPQEELHRPQHRRPDARSTSAATASSIAARY